MNRTGRRNFGTTHLGRNVAASLLAAFLLVGAGARAFAAPDELPSGRLGYRWTPEPSKQKFAMPDPVVFKAIKYGGGAVVAIWILRKLFGRGD